MSPKLRRRLSQVLIGLGLGLLTLAMCLDKLGIAEGLNRARLMLGLLSGMCLLGGALGERFTTLYKAMAIVGLNTAVIVICLELGATAYNHFTWRAPARDLHHTFLPADEDAATILQDIRAAAFDPHLYVGWMNRPYKGETLTIGADGLRQTPGTVCKAGAFRVFVFGGSTMWGEGAPDERTIPAYLQAFLAPELERPLCVMNYGQRAWVSTQSLVQLIIALQEGNIPDVVVFYDGYNDIFAGYATGRVGVPENFLHWDEFRQEDRAGKKQLIRLARKTQIGKLLEHVIAPPSTELRTVDVPYLSEALVATYLRVMRATQALARDYGFAYQFFWQPQLAAGTKPLSPGERAILDSHPWLPEPVRDLTDAVYARIAHVATVHDELIDLSDVFSGFSERLYIDPAHITSVGNRLVAQAMLDEGLRQLVLDKAADRPKPKMRVVTRDR